MPQDIAKEIKNSKFKYNYKGDVYILKYTPSLTKKTSSESVFNVTILKKTIRFKLIPTYKNIWISSTLYHSTDALLLIPDHVKSIFFKEYNAMTEYNKNWYS